MVDANDERSHGTMPRWVHVVRARGKNATHGRCDMGLLWPEGVYLFGFFGLGGVPWDDWFEMSPTVHTYPHGSHHEFGSWHDLDECHGSAHE